MGRATRGEGQLEVEDLFYGEEIDYVDEADRYRQSIDKRTVELVADLRKALHQDNVSALTEDRWLVYKGGSADKNLIIEIDICLAFDKSPLFEIAIYNHTDEGTDLEEYKVESSLAEVEGLCREITAEKDKPVDIRAEQILASIEKLFDRLSKEPQG